MNVRELLQRRAGIISDLRNLHDQADQENRELTRDEQRYWDSQMSTIADLWGAVRVAVQGQPGEHNLDVPERGNMSRREYIHALERNMEGPFNEPITRGAPGGNYGPDMGGNPYPGSDVGVRGWKDIETGREVRMYRREERAFRPYRDDLYLPDGIRADELDVGRWFRGVATGNWNGAEPEYRLMSTYDNTAGGYMMPTILAGRVIDLARAQSCLMKAGALTLPMNSKELTIARVTSDPTGFWKQENAAGTASDIGIGRLRFTAKTLIALVKMSVELVEDAPNIGTVVEQVMSEALRVELDRAGLFGVGASNEPLGLYYNDDLSEYDLGTNGAELSGWDDVLYGVQKVEEANAVNNPAYGIIYSPRTNKDFSIMKAGDGHYLERPPVVQAMRHVVSTQVSDDLTHGTESAASVIFLGSFGNVLMGIRNQITVEFSREASDGTNHAFKDLQIWARAYLRADVQVERPDQICRLVGVAESS